MTLITGLTEIDGRFISLAQLVAAPSVRVNSEVALSTGERYWVTATDTGGDVALDNGLFAHRINPPYVPPAPINEQTLNNISIAPNLVYTTVLSLGDHNRTIPYIIGIYFDVAFDATNTNCGYNIRLINELNETVYESVYMSRALSDANAFTVAYTDDLTLVIENLHSTMSLNGDFKIRYLI